MYSQCEVYANSRANNMVAQVTVSDINNGNNNDQNMKNYDRIIEETSENSSGDYREQDYLNFEQNSIGFGHENRGSSDHENLSCDNEINSTAPQSFDFISTENIKDRTQTGTHLQPSLDAKLEVKIEQLPNHGPFVRDVNGIMSPIGINGRIVYSDMSIEEANLCIKSVPEQTPVYFECPYCNILMPHPKRFLIHVKWHSFGLTNSRRMEMMKDIEQMRNEKRKIRSLERLSKNEAKDESEANFPCKDCDKVFVTKSSLKRHRIREHPSARNRSSSCRVCLVTLPGAAELRAHMSVHRNKDMFQCPECPKKYKFVHSLIKHMDTHLEKTHPCTVCTKLFGSEKQLARHMKLHEKFARGVRCHCAYCGKGYYDTFTLQIHERHHTQEKPFTCEICSSKFATNSSLQRHLKVSHSSAKPHVCAVCGRCFACARTRDRHALRVHADPALAPYQCSHCDRRYFKAKDLRNHMYKSHPKQRREQEESD